MAKQVIWSLVAKKQLKETFQILKLKNGNNEVSEVLYVQLQNILHRISMNPFIGQTTEVENIRYIIPHPGYTLFYRHSLKKIEVVVLWDNRLKMGELATLRTVSKFKLSGKRRSAFAAQRFLYSSSRIILLRRDRLSSPI